MTDHRGHAIDVDVTLEMRALFQAGASDSIDYDFERGLAAHLAAIGAPIGTAPGGAPAGAAAGAGAATAIVAAGSSIAGHGSLFSAVVASKAWLGFVALPLATAAIGIALWFGGAFENEPGAATEAKTTASSALAATPGSLAPSTDVVAPVAESNTGASPAASLGAHRTPVRRHAAESPRTAAKQSSSRAKSGLVLAETESALAPVANFPEPPASAPPAPPRERALAAAPAVSAQPAVAQPTAEERFDEEVLRRKRAVAAQEKQSDLLRLEMESLAEAKRALGRDPARAFTIARDGERQFGRSVLSEERQHVLILALLELGRFADARRVAAPYLQRHPDSPFAQRVQKALDAAGSRSR